MQFRRDHKGLRFEQGSECQMMEAVGGSHIHQQVNPAIPVKVACIQALNLGLTPLYAPSAHLQGATLPPGPPPTDWVIAQCNCLNMTVRILDNRYPIIVLIQIDIDPTDQEWGSAWQPPGCVIR